jgi:hypothetical protein
VFCPFAGDGKMNSYLFAGYTFEQERRFKPVKYYAILKNDIEAGTEYEIPEVVFDMMQKYLEQMPGKNARNL